MGDKIKYFQIGDNSSINSENIKHRDEFEEFTETTHYEFDDDELERTQVFMKHDVKRYEVITKTVNTQQENYTRIKKNILSFLLFCVYNYRKDAAMK